MLGTTASANVEWATGLGTAGPFRPADPFAPIPGEWVGRRRFRSEGKSNLGQRKSLSASNRHSANRIETGDGDDAVTIEDGDGRDWYTVLLGGGADTLDVTDFLGIDTYILNGGWPNTPGDVLTVTDLFIDPDNFIVGLFEVAPPFPPFI